MSQHRIHAKPASTAATTVPTRKDPAAEQPNYQPRTELGRELWDLRQKIIASGEPLLDAEEIDREVARRRGGIEP